MAEPITFDVLVRDRASTQFDKIARSTETLESRFARFATTARNVATTLVGVQVGKSVLEAADSFELSRSRLETITKNIGSNFHDLSGQVDAADKRMAALGFTSADTEGALASLVAVTKDPARGLRDLALAADIARGRNISLGESVLILSRVETGHVAMLSKLGIATKDANGNLLTQAEALKMLTDLYGGAASRYSQTFAGQQAAVAAELKNSAAEIGVALLPAAVDLAKVLQQDVIPPIVSLAQWLDRNRKTIEPLAKAILVGVAAWKTYVVWTRLAAASNALFVRSAAATAVSATAAGTAAGASAARAAGTAAVTAGGAGSVIGTQMGANLATSQLGLASSALMAATNIGRMGAAALGFANFISNPRSLGYPMGFNNDEGVGRNHVIGGKPLFDTGPTTTDPKTGKVYREGKDLGNGLHQLIPVENAAKVATDGLSAAQRALAAAVGRTAAQIITAAQKTVAVTAAQDGLREAIHNASQVAADNGRALTGNSDAALANRDAIRQEATALFAVIDAMKQHGASAAAQKAALSILEQALETNATLTYGDKAAVDSLLSSLGLLPAAVNVAAEALATLPTVAQNEITDGTISPGAIHQLNLAVTKAKAQGTKLGESFTSGYTPAVSKGAEKAAKAAETAMQKAMDAAKQRMQADFQTIRDEVTSTQSSLVGLADIANNAGRTDSLGTSGPPPSVLAYKKQQAQRMEQFARLFTQLDKLGLNVEDLHQFIQIGPDAIPAMQQLITAGRRGISAENSYQRRIDVAAGNVARQTAALDNSSLIHRDLTGLPPKFASAFAKELKDLHVITDRGKLDARNGARIVALS